VIVVFSAIGGELIKMCQGAKYGRF
jgi:NhaP-type Na+/H+ or K+/H+ antiporter